MAKSNAVFIANVPPGWKPVGIYTVPREILGGEFYGRRMTLTRALSVAREFNRAHLPCKGTFESKWAIVVKGLKGMPACALAGLAAAAAAREEGGASHE